MKQVIYLCLIAVFCLLIAASPLAAEEGQVVYKITAIEGTVLVMIKPSTEWVAAQVGQELRVGDGIKTLADGKAHLMTGDKSGFVMGPNSEIFVEAPLIAEPYEEAPPDVPVPVYAPDNVAEGQASKI